MTMLVSQMTTEELTMMIETIIERKFTEFFRDLDIDLELQDRVERLLEQRERVNAGEQGRPLREVSEVYG